MLVNTTLSDAIQIHPEIGLKWKKFDLKLELKRLAARKSGLRFPEFEPALAMMLVNAKRWSILDLLKRRLEWRRKNNDNPFPATYETSLDNGLSNFQMLMLLVHWLRKEVIYNISISLQSIRQMLRILTMQCALKNTKTVVRCGLQ